MRAYIRETHYTKEKKKKTPTIFEEKEKIVIESTHETALRRHEMFIEEKKNMVMGLVSTKFSNRGTSRTKNKAKRKRKGIERQVNYMRRQINLMKSQILLKEKDLRIKKNEYELKKDVFEYKQFLSVQKYRSKKRMNQHN